jgi:hypothetical protein
MKIFQVSAGAATSTSLLVWWGECDQNVYGKITWKILKQMMLPSMALKN